MQNINNLDKLKMHELHGKHKAIQQIFSKI